MSKALLEHSSPDGKVLTIDCDPNASEAQAAALGSFGERSSRASGNFRDIATLASMNGFTSVDGILYDLGVSSGMLDIAQYGMSIRNDAPLDMRFDPSIEFSARDLVNTMTESELVELLKSMDEIRFARRIASRIISERRDSEIETTGHLANIVSSAIPKRFHPRTNHPATKTFLALRVRVNDEIETLRTSLAACPDLLAPSGTLVVLCYSSFEDRAVKELWRENRDTLKRLTKKPVTPSEDEIKTNPRSRSARLRAYRKIA